MDLIFKIGFFLSRTKSEASHASCIGWLFSGNFKAYVREKKAKGFLVITRGEIIY